jgi:DNA-binding IclR family transcriptional regulator
MGQSEILEILKKNEDWTLSKELLKITNMSPGGLYRLLRILEKTGYIIKKKAIKVILDKDRLNNSPKHTWAFRVKK